MVRILEARTFEMVYTVKLVQVSDGFAVLTYSWENCKIIPELSTEKIPTFDDALFAYNEIINIFVAKLAA
jgi:hypothetical protein